MDSRQTNPASGHSGSSSTAQAHRAASPVGEVAAAAGAFAEQWYFRIDGREYGPTSRTQLERFLAPPRLCKSLEVMCSNREGHWFLIAKHETVEMVLERFGIVVEVPEEVAPSKAKSALVYKTSAPVEEEVREYVRPKPVYKAPNPIVDWFSETFEALAERLIKYKLPILLVVSVVSINLAMLYLFVDIDGRNRTILTRYESMWSSAVKMEADETSEETWRTYADESQIELDGFIKVLARSASVQNPVEQQLLFVGRDILKPVFAATEPPPKASPTRRVIQRYFKLLNEKIPRGSATSS